jgi:hypothetical protein
MSDNHADVSPKGNEAVVQAEAPIATREMEKPVIEASVEGEALQITKTKSIPIDELSKWTAVALVFLYVVGFLITSLNDFRFGFTQMNPLRPRILAAGGWFTIFLAVPLAVVTEWRQHALWKQDLSKWHKAALLLWTYYTLGNVVVIYAAYIFTFDNSNSPTGPTPAMWKVLLIAVGFIVAVLLFINYYSRIPRWIVATSIFAFFGWFIGDSVNDLFVKKMFLSNAPTLWIVGVGAVAFLEMRRRRWKLMIGDWPWTMVLFLGLLTMFATAYYPHIMPKWGGGAPLPITIVLSKDSPFLTGQTVSCFLIDETEAGFYLIGKDEKHATFVPRNEVSLVHFADSNEQSIFTPPKK